MTSIPQQATELLEILNKPFDTITNDADIYYCFRLLLGRNPKIDEWGWHSHRAGADLTSTVKSYLASLEFRNRGLTTQNANLVDVKLGTVDGVSLYAHANDPIIGRSVLAGNYEPEVTQLFRQHVTSGMNVVDIGANIGYYTMLSASLVGSNGSVLAIEPNKENVRLLEASRRLNKYDNVRVAGVAAGAEIGVLALHAGESNGTTIALDDATDVLQAVEIVPCTKVDLLLRDYGKVDFIKVHVEGAELLALIGMKSTIARDHPIITSEFSPESLPVFSHCTATEYLKFLIDMKYSLNVIEKGTSNLIQCHMDMDKVMRTFDAQSSDHLDLFCKPAVRT